MTSRRRRTGPAGASASGPGATWPAVPPLREPDPLDHRSGPRTTWTTVNAGEAVPGVLSALGASFFVTGAEVGIRRCFHDLGVLPRTEVRVPDRADERLSGVFLGRYAGNLDALRAVADATPGTSGEALERQAFAGLRAGVPPSRSDPRRYPFVALRAPRAVAGLRSRMARDAAATAAFWTARTTAAPPATFAASRALLDEALRGFAHVMGPHFMATMVVQGVQDRLRELCEDAGLPGHDLVVVGGGDDLEEVRLVAALRRAADGELPLEAVLAEFGFQGTDVGEISSRSWREDPSPVERMLAAYRRSAGWARTSRAEQAVRREEAVAELLAALPRTTRVLARVLVRYGRATLPLREVGKASFLRAMDVGRLAARAAGGALAAEGRLADPEDVFGLGLAELLAPAGDAASASRVRDLAAARVAQRASYADRVPPPLWTGTPQARPVAVPSSDASVSRLEGIGASAGTVTARARVALTAADCDALEPGEVLVCPHTDPSWAAAFPLAGALVTDVGATVSHGAIIAREMGLPCVVNTGTGTVAVRTGDVVTVDGRAGTVTIDERSSREERGARDEAATTAGEAATPAPVPAGEAAPADDGPEHELAVLRVLGLKGRTDEATLAAVLGLDVDAVAAVAADAVAGGRAKRVRDALRLTPDGRARVAALLAAERAAVDAAALEAAYERFDAPNDRLKALMTRWQLREGEPNDHGDEAYDGAVAADLAALHAETRALVDDLAVIAPRLRPYARRLADAATAVADGRREMLAAPTADSFHTAWFELHEDLIGLLGRTREDEARAGRAA